MKTDIPLILAFLLIVSSCSKNDGTFPHIENITKGQKWTLKIGSTPVEVYEQLQELSMEEAFNKVNLTYRQPISKPEAIQSDINLYNSITIETTSGALERILITFQEDKVSSIEKGGGLLNPIQKWPEHQPERTSISINDLVHTIKEKLIAIYQIQDYQDNQIVLPEKPLERPYDPDMANYEEWYFTFTNDISHSRNGRNSVRLYFKNNRLNKIQNTYEEFDLVN